MSSDSEEAGSNNCPKCGTILEPYGDDGAECPNEKCRWVQTSGFEGTTLDDSWSNGPWDNDGETVAVGTEDEELGDTSTQDWPDAVDIDPSDTTDERRRIIKAVARYPDKNAVQLADILGLEGTGNIYSTIDDYWPERNSNIYVNQNRKNPQSVNSQIENIRRRALNGETASEIADDLLVSRAHISRLLRGDIDTDYQSKIPELRYNKGTKRWEKISCEYCGEAFSSEQSLSSHKWQCPENPDNIETEETADDETSDREQTTDDEISETESEETDTGTETTTDSQQYDELLQKAERIQRKQQEELELVRRRFEASLYQRIKWWLFGADEDGDSA